MSLLDSVTLRQSSMHILRGGKQVEQEADGRVCEASDCTTQLSRYNPATTCCRHDGWSASAPTKQRRR